MTRTNKAWAIGITLFTLCYGVSVMFGHIPGLGSQVGTFSRIAALTAMAAHEYGYFLTGLGAIGLGAVVAMLCLIGGKGSPDAGLGMD